jgi:hypothetical protein
MTATITYTDGRTLPPATEAGMVALGRPWMVVHALPAGGRAQAWDTGLRLGLSAS